MTGLLDRCGVFRALTVAWLLGIFYFSSQPTVPFPATVWGLDKILHFGAYAGLAVVMFPAHRRWREQPARWAVSVALWAALYGISDEFHQMFVPGRTATVADFLADAAGASFGAWAMFRFAARRS